MSDGDIDDFGNGVDGDALPPIPPRDTTTADVLADDYNPIMSTQTAIADKLRGIPWFKQHNVKIIEQNSQEIIYIIKNEMGPLAGVTVVIGIDELENEHPALLAKITVTCTEYVTVNRQMQGFVTALDVTQAIIQVLDGFQWHFDKFTHKEDYQKDKFVCTATYRGMIDRFWISQEEAEA